MSDSHIWRLGADDAKLVYAPAEETPEGAEPRAPALLTNGHWLVREDRIAPGLIGALASECGKTTTHVLSRGYDLADEHVAHSVDLIVAESRRMWEADFRFDGLVDGLVALDWDAARVRLSARYGERAVDLGSEMIIRWRGPKAYCRYEGAGPIGFVWDVPGRGEFGASAEYATAVFAAGWQLYAPERPLFEPFRLVEGEREGDQDDRRVVGLLMGRRV